MDLPDFLALLACFSGPGVPAPPGCEVFDIDGDGDVDLTDVIAFQGELTGAR